MIGTILSMRYVGKKSWKDALVFWIVLLFASAILSFVIGAAAVFIPYVAFAGLFVWIIAFMVLAIKWYKFKPMNALKVMIVAIVIDAVIVGILVTVLFFAFAVVFAEFFELLFPVSVLFGV